MSAAPNALTRPVPAAYQVRYDHMHDGFKHAGWVEIERTEFDAIKAVMGGHGPKMIAGDVSRGDLRCDDGGWFVELRELYAHPPVGQEPVAWGVRYKNGVFCDLIVSTAAAAERVKACAGFSDNKEIVAFYDAHPAQGVDLGQFRQAVLDQFELARSEETSGPMSQASVAAAAKRRDSLLALIDGQAVAS